MAKIGEGYQEIRGRLGFFGWTSRILLSGWQLLMLGWIVSYSKTVSSLVDAGGAQGAGAAIGGGIGVGFIIFIWASGTVILGIFVLLTRRSKAIVPIEETK